MERGRSQSTRWIFWFYCMGNVFHVYDSSHLFMVCRINVIECFYAILGSYNRNNHLSNYSNAKNNEYRKFLEAKLAKINDIWSNFHNTEIEKWLERTNILINKTYFDAVEERDKVWKKRFEGIKPKSKSSN